MNTPTTWDLPRYFYTGLEDPKLIHDTKQILPRVQEFSEKYSKTLAYYTEAVDILEFYHAYEGLMQDITKPSYYLFYRSALNTQDTDIQRAQGEINYIFTGVGTLLLFVAQAWKTIGKEKLLAWSKDPVLESVKNDLIRTAEMLDHILSEKEEYILNIKSRPLSLANDLLTGLIGSYEFEMQIDGEIKKLTEEEVRSYRQHSVRNIRREAYRALRKVYNSPQNQITLGNIYTSIVKNWSSEMILRKYPNILTERNIGEQLDDEVVNMLLDEVQKAYPIYERYLQKKATFLGLQFGPQRVSQDKRFTIWDVSAPIGSMEKEYSFDDAFALHLSVMEEFDKEFYTYSLAMREQGRLDIYPKFGKQNGAFASYRKGSESFVLLNFNGRIRDISTLSHELGHAIHGHLSQIQEGPVYDSPLSLAETASIFSEMLLGEKIKSIISKEEYLSYLNERLGDIFATIFRQVQYVVFEREVHTQIHQGKEFTYKELNTLWRESQIRLYGNNMYYDVDEKDESGWSMIPHIFHTPFYCYAYAFGNLLVFSLYNRYKTNPNFKEDYKDILRAGGSLPPRELLLQYGIDIASREFFQSGLREVEKLVEEFEQL